MFAPFIDLFTDPQTVVVLSWVYKTSFVWLPVILLIVGWEVWVNYRRAQFFAKQTYVLLEIKLPREVTKSPQAAEFFISGLYSTIGESNWYEKYWKGQVRAWVSLELVSIGGKVHFFVWARSGARNQIESNLYSQFPGIEIYEVPDYTLPVSYNPETDGIYATEFDLTKKDAYPIKTYIDYGMNKNPEEEYKIDPMTPLIEALGSLGPGHQAWIQIIIQAHKAEDKDPKGSGKLVDLKWAKNAEEEIEGIIKKAKGEVGADGKIVPGTGRQLTDVEKETISALSRSVSKPGFDTGIRLIYFAPKDIFSMTNVGGLVGGLMHFNSSLNGFKPARGSAPKYKGLFAWMDRGKKKRTIEFQSLFDAYKRRAYFYSPYKKPSFVLNTEELATLYHFPGGVSATPTFSRITSKKAEAPSNLPQ